MCVCLQSRLLIAGVRSLRVSAGQNNAIIIIMSDCLWCMRAWCWMVRVRMFIELGKLFLPTFCWWTIVYDTISAEITPVINGLQTRSIHSAQLWIFAWQNICAQAFADTTQKNVSIWEAVLVFDCVLQTNAFVEYEITFVHKWKICVTENWSWSCVLGANARYSEPVCKCAAVSAHAPKWECARDMYTRLQ